jgi:hypothetical protein
MEEIEMPTLTLPGELPVLSPTTLLTLNNTIPELEFSLLQPAGVNFDKLPDVSCFMQDINMIPTIQNGVTKQNNTLPAVLSVIQNTNIQEGTSNTNGFPVTARYELHTLPITPPDTYDVASTRLKTLKSPVADMLKREYTDEHPPPILKRTGSDYFAMVLLIENMIDAELKWVERHIRSVRNRRLDPVRVDLMNKFTGVSPEWEIVQKENIPPKSSQVVPTWSPSLVKIRKVS